MNHPARVALLLTLMGAAAGCFVGEKSALRSLIDSTKVVAVDGPHAPLRYFTNVPVPISKLHSVSTRAAVLGGRLLGRPDAEPEFSKPLDVVFCANIPTLLRLERERGVGWHVGDADSWALQRPVTHRGWYFHDVGLIALLAAPQEDLRRILAHEVAHHVFRTMARRRSPDSLNEGFAEFVALWSVHMPDAEPADADVRGARYATILREQLAASGAPDLVELCRLDHDEFHDARSESRNYAHSWSLVHFLVTTREPAFRDRLPALMADLNAGRSVRTALSRIAASAELERAWHAHVAGLAASCRLEPIHGSFYLVGRDWIGVSHGWTAIAVAARGTGWERATSLTAGLPAFPWTTFNAGFVVDYVSPDDFVLIGLRDVPRDVRCLRFRNGAFGERQERSLPIDFDPATGPLRLDREENGRVRLLQGDAEIAEFSLDGPPRGRLGIHLEKLEPADGSYVEAQVTFTDVAAR